MRNYLVLIICNKLTFPNVPSESTIVNQINILDFFSRLLNKGVFRIRMLGLAKIENYSKISITNHEIIAPLMLPFIPFYGNPLFPVWEHFSPNVGIIPL